MPTASLGGRAVSIPLSAQIYPRRLPLLFTIQRTTKRVTPIIVVAGLGYGAAQYARARTEQARAAGQAEEAERLRRMSALMDAYGDRSSMASLEQASRVYEAQQQQQQQQQPPPEQRQLGNTKAHQGRR